MRPHKRLLSAALLFIAVLTGLSLWFVASGSPVDVTSRLSQGGSLRVGFAMEAPYAYVDAHGRVTGEAPEVFRRVAQRLGIKHIDWVHMDFASLLPELQTGRIDAVAAGMFVTPERKALAAFTRPTAHVKPALVVRAGEDRLPTSPLTADLGRASDMRWVTMIDATENDLLEQAGVAKERISTVPQIDRGVRAIHEGLADGLAISAVTARQLVTRHSQWSLETRILSDATPGLPAFVFRKEDHELRDEMDQALEAFLGTDEHIALVRGFGFTDEELPTALP